MASRRREQDPAVVRLRPPRVVAVELWDLELRSGILWDHMEADALLPALVEAVERLKAGRARTRSQTPIPAAVQGLQALWLAGGRAEAIDGARLAKAIGRPVWIAADPTAVAPPGARALTPDATTRVTIDLGQSHLKVFAPGARLTVPRPWDRLPLRGGVRPPSLDDARHQLRAWVIDALTQVRVDPDVVVVALPCELGDHPTPGGSSYEGLSGDSTFVPEVIAAAGWSPRRIYVLNDAELAAAAATLDPRTHDTSTLVLTLGFGVGAAMCTP